MIRGVLYIILGKALTKLLIVISAKTDSASWLVILIQSSSMTFFNMNMIEGWSVFIV
jgi:hypothetical protein